MEMIRCKKCGIFYRENMPDCPYCSEAEGEKVAQKPESVAAKEVVQESEPVEEVVVVQEAVAVEPVAQNENPPTSTLTDIDPVVGWLVCINGNEKGKDYRIHSDNNYIGSEASMDICISNDETISQENHAIITYDSLEKMFYFAPGVGRSIVRLNGKAVLMTAELKLYDRLTLGETELLFVPLCGNEFQW